MGFWRIWLASLWSEMLIWDEDVSLHVATMVSLFRLLLTRVVLCVLR
jgi:hypothetical protein